MRIVRYSVAMSLDGYIAGPEGEIDWIFADPDIDFAALFRQFDTAIMGRKTYELTRQQGEAGALPGMEVHVFSQTLDPADCPGVNVSADARQTVTALKERAGKDIWLFGGGALFRSLLELDLVDEVEVAILPILLGRGLPLLPPIAKSHRLRLTKHRLYEKTGTMLLTYAITRGGE